MGKEKTEQAKEKIQPKYQEAKGMAKELIE